MDTAYGIFEYNTNNFCAYISYQTETPLSYIKQKPQITYLDNYLTNLTSSPSKKVFIYENEYIDKHYLEDYSYYYVKCFKTYRKTCSRVHFFEFHDDNLDFKKEFSRALNGESTFISNENYLGYIVIRPIPQAFFAKICLKSYYEEKRRLSKYIILKKQQVSLFGINLEVKSVAFQEQDKILSACATTSLWSFFHAHPHKNISALPSSSSITQSAYPEQNGYVREFPNTGLSTEMICRSLRAYDFAPEYFEFSKKDNDLLPQDEKIKLLKEYIFSYCSSGLPLILGVLVKDSCTSNEKGLHAVTILGYSLKEEEIDSPLISHKLEKLYVHDDRLGPFLKIDFDTTAFNVSLFSNATVTENHHFENEQYIPDTLIVGLYHKIRIPYLGIKNTCLDLQELISQYLERKGQKQEASIFNDFKWDIQIKLNKDLKSFILSSQITNKEKYLTKSWPKYLWSATAYYKNILVFEMLFDATDIDHGDVFLDIIPIDANADGIVELLKVYSDDHFHNKIQQGFNISNQDTYVWGIIKYFREKDSYTKTLSELYGYLKIPKMIKAEELTNDMIINQCEVRLNKQNSSATNFQLVKHLPVDIQYIWVIDKEGFLCIGKEKIGSSRGHPTLTDGMPARIGGQVKFNDINGIWEVDPFSGRYSSEYTEEEKREYVENAIKYKFASYFLEEEFVAILPEL